MKGSKNIRGSTEWERRFIGSFNQLCGRHRPWQVWRDFVHMSACAIANAVDRRPDVWDSREHSYMAAAKRYSKDELGSICELFSTTVLALEENPAQDFLGKLYMQLDFGSEWHGQFFTPWHVAELMARVLADGGVKGQAESQGYISVNDPCCGAGCMLMAFAKVCKDDLGINYQQSVLFVAQDVDPVVAQMCYIQISLLGCPGYVVAGDSLSEPVGGSTIEPSYKRPEDIWFTPLYFTDIWTLHRMKSREAGWQNPGRPTQMPAATKPTGKKPFSWKEFFARKGEGKK